MRDQLVALANLAAMDASTRDLDREMVTIPQRIEAMRADVTALETLLSAARGQLEEARRVEALQADEVRDRNEALSRARGKVGHATNMREAEMAEREVDAVRTTVRDREVELERIRASIEAKAKSLAEHQRQLEEASASFAEDERAAAARMAEIETSRASVLTGRDDLAARVGDRLLKQYTRIKTKRDPAVVIIDAEMCTGCRVAFPAQLYIEMTKGDKIHDCPMCRRIVIHKCLLG